MDMLSWLIFGLIVGVIAKFLMPGRDPGGCIITIIIGIAGSFTGGYLGRMFFGGTQGQPAGWIGSILGAMLLLFIYRMLVGSKNTD